MNDGMITQISGKSKSLRIGRRLPTVVIGERINPLGKREKAQVFLADAMSLVKQEAIRQVEAGAEVLDVNMAAPGIEEEMSLPAVVKAVQDTVDVPLCIDSINPKALAAALGVYQGKALVNSVNGKQHCLHTILPIVKEFGAAVVALTMDDAGIPDNPMKRLEIARKIVEAAEGYRIPIEDVVVDCAALSVGSVQGAAAVTLETIHLVREELGANMTLGVSNVSFGLPDRRAINAAFLPIAIAYGVTCPMIDVTVRELRKAVFATDVLLARDAYAARYIGDYRKGLKTA